jgi:septal ring factor EnvC (AmiA/AmiB activator)
MKTPSFATVAGYAGVIVVVAVALSYVTQTCSSKRLEKKIETLEARKTKIINSDSLRDLIESRILDSLNLKVDRQDAKIAELTRSLKVTRRQNEAIEKRLDNMRVAMPEF